MGYLVIACYRPKPGKGAELLAAVRDHLPILRGEGLATGRASIVMRASDGTLVELFEWASKEAVDRAHSNPAVLDLWKRFSEAAEYVRLRDIQETSDLFAHFEPVDDAGDHAMALSSADPGAGRAG
ncbi:hypothetical protein SOCEGT47_006780 [Sorangium cellulosum]|uniref:ABM domain-containing protein n=1 Tax=Sorangium cellulosum TaxID=56 RepID=A0A4P2PUY2_SORCE|nr:hypothetical protein [Sorangium cellulosum]AUX20213.1 hypothetical protein SOCEGT47_006780 [Sorangium cellulosum]